MISTIAWVGRGKAKNTPTKFVDVDQDGEGEQPEDLQEMQEVPQPVEEKKSKKKAKGGDMEEEDSSSEEIEDDAGATVDERYNMDDYSDGEEMAWEMEGDKDFQAHMSYNIKKDPYVTSKNLDTINELDDYLIRDSDLIILAGVSEDEEVSHLDVYVFESVEQNAYIHHDYLLPSFPLCMAWLDFPVASQTHEGRSNMVAVGTFEPYIEIWDLDIVDCPTPIAILGGPEDLEQLGVDGPLTLVPGSHTESVLGLSWNKNQRNALASASADHTVKLWDLTNATCLKTLTHHKDKVQSVQWNPVESPYLASGGFDRAVHICDVRTAAGSTMSATLSADIENIQWIPSPHHNHILISTEDGFVYCYDILKGMSQPLWKLQAHTKPVHTIAVNEKIPGLIATGSVEANAPLKIWDISKGAPECLFSGLEDIGQVFTAQFSVDEPFYLACGVKDDKPLVVNTLNFPGVKNAYGNWTEQKKTEQVPDFAKMAISSGAPLTTSRTTTLHAGKNKARKGKGKKGGKKK
eukprot:TRINITY_DN3536_c0_g1_i1.p1 TRINITY_DN3536_c0_g1~~TRINITY_DN3536_c0_g1_i1.p1  ORF type:complete len:520 (-),score=146.15 TRINITY_DN3536_c0_g1_i1:269-1828(-)